MRYYNIFKSKKNKRMLHRALQNYIFVEADSLPEIEQPDVHFTPEYESKMSKLIHKQEKIYYYWTNTTSKKILCIAVIVMILATIMTFSVSALREAFIRFIVETYETFTSIILKDESFNVNDVGDPVEPSYIPDGFVCVSKNTYEKASLYVYQNSSGNSIKCWVKSLEDHTIDTEKTNYEKIIINQYEGVYYENKGINTIIFSSNKIVCEIKGDISKEELITIANSMKI